MPKSGQTPSQDTLTFTVLCYKLHSPEVMGLWKPTLTTRHCRSMGPRTNWTQGLYLTLVYTVPNHGSLGTHTWAWHCRSMCPQIKWTQEPCTVLWSTQLHTVGPWKPIPWPVTAEVWVLRLYTGSVPCSDLHSYILWVLGNPCLGMTMPKYGPSHLWHRVCTLLWTTQFHTAGPWKPYLGMTLQKYRPSHPWHRDFLWSTESPPTSWVYEDPYFHSVGLT